MMEITKDRDEVAKRVLQRHFTTLRGKINIASIRCHLYEQRAIDTNIYDKLTDAANATLNDRSELLLRHLISKGEDGYRHLVRALHQCGTEDAVQASLARDLEHWYELEYCNDGGIANETRDGKVTSNGTPSSTRHQMQDHNGRYSESSSVSSTIRAPSSAGYHLSAQVSMNSGSDR